VRHWLRQLNDRVPPVYVAPLRQADPLPEWVRASVYRRQVGGRFPTPRQSRRIRHKLNRATKRGQA
jgi:hypothetical protein